MAQTHFPGSIVAHKDNYEERIIERATRPSTQERNNLTKILTFIKIKWVIYTFGFHKSSMLDGNIPVPLQKKGEKTIVIIKCLFRGSLAWSHIPSEWRSFTVILIQMADKRKQDELKCFRPRKEKRIDTLKR